MFSEVDWVIAWGKGTLSTRIPADASADELDGPCFHHARAALDDAKARRLVFAFGGFEDERLTAFANYYSALYWSWTRRQRTVATAWRTASRLRVHPSALSHLRRRMAWPLVAEADRVFRNLLATP